jgi:hypothetical protein
MKKVSVMPVASRTIPMGHSASFGPQSAVTTVWMKCISSGSS